MLRVAKFGGSSLADADKFRRAARIVEADQTRSVVIVAAPGRRTREDKNLTDLFFAAAQGGDGRRSAEEVFFEISDRFSTIVEELGIDLDIEEELDAIWQEILNDSHSLGFVLCRGEYLSGRIMAKLLDFEFFDAANLISFNQSGQYDPVSTKKNCERLMNVEGAVIPGSYGSEPDGTIKLFPRGGDDVTGSIIAAELKASTYEIWTDIDGVRMADPRIVQSPRKIDTLTYRELRKLTYMGISVLQEEAVIPVRAADIPIHIRNMNIPSELGTLIVSEKEAPERDPGDLVGIAGRKGYVVIILEKFKINRDTKFAKGVLEILEKYNVSLEYLPGSIDSINLIMEKKEVEGRLEEIVAELKTYVSPDSFTVYNDLAMILVVCDHINSAPATTARIFNILADMDIKVRALNQSSNGMSLMLSVDSADFETTIRAIYDTMTNS